MGHERLGTGFVQCAGRLGVVSGGFFIGRAAFFAFFFL